MLQVTRPLWLSDQGQHSQQDPIRQHYELPPTANIWAIQEKESYLSAEVQSAYSTAPAHRAVTTLDKSLHQVLDRNSDNLRLRSKIMHSHPR